jgi:hypothetical protein
MYMSGDLMHVIPFSKIKIKNHSNFLVSIFLKTKKDVSHKRANNQMEIMCILVYTKVKNVWI